MTIIRLPHLTWKQRGALAAGALIFAAVGGSELAGAPAASATDAAVTYSQTCERGTVTVTSSWDGVTHIHVLGPSPEIAFDVPGRQSASTNFAIRPNPLTVTVSSSNGHLTGELTHTFTTNGCATTTTTTTAPVASSTTIMPTPPSTATVGSTVVSSPGPTTPPASAPGTTAPRSRPPAPVAPSSIAPQHLPATGAGDVLFVIAVVGLFLLIAGVVLHRVKRSES
jgi:LPXTG-motif cell wall-anchored protein